MASLTEYPGDRVLLPNDCIGYFTAVLKAGKTTVDAIINSDKYKAVHGFDHIPVEIEYPMTDQRYPYIHVMYRNTSFVPMSLEERRFLDYKIDDVEKTDEYAFYKFDGSYLVNIYATTILEREIIADCCIAALGVDNEYRNLLYQNPYIAISPNMHTLASSTSNESFGTPWDSDTMTTFRQFTFNVTGDFCWRVSVTPEFITGINIEPEYAR